MKIFQQCMKLQDTNVSPLVPEKKATDIILERLENADALKLVDSAEMNQMSIQDLHMLENKFIAKLKHEYDTVIKEYESD